MSTITMGVGIRSFYVTNTLNSLYILNIVVPPHVLTSSHPQSACCLSYYVHWLASITRYKTLRMQYQAVGEVYRVIGNKSRPLVSFSVHKSISPEYISSKSTAWQVLWSLQRTMSELLKLVISTNYYVLGPQEGRTLGNGSTDGNYSMRKPRQQDMRTLNQG